MRTLTPAATLIALAFGTIAAPSFAQQPASDIRCMLVSNVFANNEKNSQAKQIASAAVLFYSGRVSALPTATTQSALAAEAKQLTAANAAPTMHACAQRMSDGLKALQTLGAKVEQEKR